MNIQNTTPKQEKNSVLSKESHQLSTLSKIFPEKLILVQETRNFPPFVKGKVHDCICMDMSMISILSQSNSVQTLTPYFFKTHFNFNFLSMPMHSKC